VSTSLEEYLENFQFKQLWKIGVFNPEVLAKEVEHFKSVGCWRIGRSAEIFASMRN
jgi:hypothetical protein